MKSRNLLRYGPATGNGLTATVNTDGSLHISGTPTAQWGGIRWPQELTVFAGRTLRISSSVSGTSPGLNVVFDIYDKDGTVEYLSGSQSKTVPADATSVQLRVQTTLATPEPMDFDLKVQVEEGATATEWEKPDTTDYLGGGRA
ncbi:hypothetical protein [Bifidobacterium vansinderenii]|uniref:Uncharacterized protein n=1 Tax=Bifidobacterium vansinderenii TaxID=1984871 RepID=A0A229VW95_9BIFI|nr:hypothetical protein [Bifidobacterium vansinderenii]OXM99890.1 hypothetical protein Tam10B_1853 [Bifidobacterium vansinderenii]